MVAVDGTTNRGDSGVDHAAGDDLAAYCWGKAMKYNFIILSALPMALALAGCGGGGDTVTAKDESVESVAKKVAATGNKPNPGRWEMSVAMGKVEMTGVPAAAKDMLAKQAGTATTMAICITPEMANKTDGAMFKNAGPADCKYDRFSMADGKIDGVMNCSTGGQKINIATSGTYSSDAWDMASKINTDMGGGRTMAIESITKAKRVGECDGSEVSAS